MSDHSHAAPAPQVEPQSPWWLPLLGVVLFVIAGVYLLASPATPTTAPAPAGSAAPQTR